MVAYTVVSLRTPIVSLATIGALGAGLACTEARRVAVAPREADPATSETTSVAQAASTGPAMAKTRAERADVMAVTVSGKPGAYSFAVTLASPDSGCERYANFWEVITPDGELVYRRVLQHSHTDEQPFTRSGGPIAAAANDALIVRAHLHPDGYGGSAQSGTAGSGFSETRREAGLAQELATHPPLPSRCAF